MAISDPSPLLYGIVGAIRVLKESFKFKPRRSLWMSIIIVHLIVINVNSKIEVEEIGDFLKYITSSFCIFIYLYCLCFISFYKTLRKQRVER